MKVCTLTAARSGLFIQPIDRYVRIAWNSLFKGVNLFLHCTLSLAAQCIVIGPVCVFATGGWALFVCGSVTTITRNCIHRSSPNWVCR